MATGTTRRERQREATTREIVDAARSLLTDPGGLSLRAVAHRMGMTAPALYRYVSSYQDLVFLVAADIDAETAQRLRAAAAEFPDDDPAAQIIAASIAFRHWALTHREEFSLVFANPLTRAHGNAEDITDQQTGLVFTGLLLELWRKYDFPVPAVEDLDPAVVATFDDPQQPVRIEEIPEHARGLLWMFTQSWVALYGTVTLEVFGHCDPRVIGSGALFRAMLAQQAETFGIAGELPRLRPVIEAALAEPPTATT